MRTNIKVVGIGARRTGINKDTNQSYDFTPVSIVYSDGRTTGFRADTVNINTPDIPADLSVNCEYDAVMHMFKNRVYIDAIL